MTVPPFYKIISVFYLIYTAVDRLLLSSRTNGIVKSRPSSHGLLPDLFIFVIVLFVTESDFLFPLSADRFAVGVLVCGCGVAYGNNVVRPPTVTRWYWPFGSVAARS
jgi:hypothetical protein